MEKLNKLKILKELKSQLLEHFKDNVNRVILFGSRVGGNARSYSDYDVLIVLKKSYDWRAKNKIFSLCYNMDLKYDILIDAKIISADELKELKGSQPFIVNALCHGLTV